MTSLNRLIAASRSFTRIPTWNNGAAVISAFLLRAPAWLLRVNVVAAILIRGYTPED